MSTTSSVPSETSVYQVLKRKSDDVGWAYGSLVDPLNKDRVKCNLCGHVSTGGIYRLKQHVAHIGTSVAKCKKFTNEAQNICKKSLEEAKRKKRERQEYDQEVREDVHVSSVGEEEVCIGSSSSGPHQLGPMDKFIRLIDGKASSAEAMRQQNMNEALFKERTHQVAQYVGRWAYAHAIPFNACENDEFKQMCEAIGKFGPGYMPPTQYDLWEKLLSEEYARTKSLLNEREEENMKNGCSIMTDAWTDMKRRSIMNLCIHCSMGTSFLKSKETSDVSHTSEVIFELVDKAKETSDVSHTSFPLY